MDVKKMFDNLKVAAIASDPELLCSQACWQNPVSQEGLCSLQGKFIVIV
jgi:hypothetical protein